MAIELNKESEIQAIAQSYDNYMAKERKTRLMMVHMENFFNMIADMRSNKDLRNHLPKVMDKEEKKPLFTPSEPTQAVKVGEEKKPQSVSNEPTQNLLK